jgi:hypothetical protein
MNPFTEDPQDEPVQFVGPDSYTDHPPAERSLRLVRPTGTIFMVFLMLKTLPFAVYLFGWLLVSSAPVRWFLALSLAGADFWFTKNVAGRLILGMRWSSRVTDTAATQWVFEYVDGGVQATAAQRRTFWVLLAGTICIWILFSLFAIIRLSLGWCVVNAIGAALAGANAAGYLHCDKSIAKDVRQEATDFVKRSVIPFVRAQAENVLLGTEEPHVAGREDAASQ